MVSKCIAIDDYGTPTAAQKEKFLETSPITRNLTAVKNRCFLPLSYNEITPASPIITGTPELHGVSARAALTARPERRLSTRA